MNHYTMLGAVLLLGITAQGRATEAPLRAVKVQFADLNLEQAQGAQVLYARIRFAARKVCVNDGVEGLLMAPKVSACRRATIDAAIASIDNARLTAMHRQTRGTLAKQMAGGTQLR